MDRFAFFIISIVLLNHINPEAAATQTLNPTRRADDDRGIIIPVTKCCRHQYSILTDSCQNHADDVSAVAWTPAPLVSRRDNRTRTVSADDLEITHAVPACADGYVPKVVTDFRFYDDGVMEWGSWRLEAGQFCVDDIEGWDGGAESAARFCVVDPCNATSCIRKCCPHGMAVDDINKICRIHPKEFVPIISHENGSVTDGSDTLVLDGAGIPVCANEMFSLRPALYPEDEFYILPSGELYVVSYTHDNRIRENCIDTFFDGNITDIRALVCFQETVADSEAQYIALNIYPYLMFISAAFLIFTFLVYAAIAELRNVTGFIIMCYSITLAAMFLSLGTIQLATSSINQRFCTYLAVIAHFSFLSTFTWLNVMSIATWWDLCDRGSNRSVGTSDRKRDYRCRCVLFALYAWGVPFIFVTVVRVMDVLDIGIQADFGVGRCWFSDDVSTATYLYGPIGVLVLINIVFFLLTVVKLHQASSPAQAVFNLPVKRRLYVIFCLFTLMGVSWIMEILSFAVGGLAYIWIPTDILNILTGIFTFVILVCNRNARQLIVKKMTCNRNADKGNYRDSLADQSQTFMSIAEQNIRSSTYVGSSFNNEDLYNDDK